MLNGMLTLRVRFQVCGAAVTRRLILRATAGHLHTRSQDLTLAQLSQIEVTTPSKEPLSAFRTPAEYTHATRTPLDAEENFFLSGFAGITSNGFPLMPRFKYKRSICSEAAQQLRIEATPEWRPFYRWRLRGTYSYLYINVYKSPHSGNFGTVAGIVGASTQHQATIQSFFEISKALQLDLTYRYVSQLRAQSIPAYSTSEARVAWQFAPKLELSVVGRNLFQPHHPEYDGDPDTLIDIRRSVYAMIS